MSNNELQIYTLNSEGYTTPLAPFENLLNRQLIIPEYQREYAWEKDHIVDLFKSIKEHYNELLEKIKSNIDQYEDYSKLEQNQNRKRNFTFLGSIVFCIPEKNSVDNYLIIDGQQRITTLLMILKFIKSKAQNIKEQLENEKSNLHNNKLEDYINHIKSLKTKIENIDRIIKSVNIKRENGSDKQEETQVFDYINKDNISYENNNLIEKKIEECLEDAFDGNFSSDGILGAKYFISLTDYILQYILVCWIRIQGKDSDSFSIDLFNIMNSTGEPLTGFEIFKSKMLQKNQSGGQEIDKIREKISKEFKFDRKKILKHTGNLMLFLAIYRGDYSENDGVSDKEWKKQKKYVDIIFKKDLQELKKVCEDFKYIYEFYFNKWLKNNNKKEKPIYKKEIGLCFKLLTNTTHDRVLPILLMFNKEPELKEAIKTCTAFSVIWRVLHQGGTGGVDKVYLDIAYNLANKRADIKALKKGLVDALKKKIQSKTMWIDELKEVPIYDKHKKVTRFLLLIAINKMTYDEQDARLTLAQKEHGILNPYAWEEDEKYESIDHMVPQKDSTKLKNVHVLGNLTFLPKSINSKLGDANFQNRKIKFNQMINLQSKDKLPYLPILKEVCSEHGGSQKDTDKRTEKLGEIIWTVLAEDWLGWKD